MQLNFTLEKNRSYRHLRKKSKVDKAIEMANKIERELDPLRDVPRDEETPNPDEDFAHYTMSSL